MSALGAEHLRCRLLLTVRFAGLLRLVGLLRLAVRFALTLLVVRRVVQHVVTDVVLRLRFLTTFLRLRLAGAGLHTVTVVHLRRAGLRLTTAFLALLRL